MKSILNSLKMLIVMSVLLGGIYPLLITAVGQTVFKNKSNGSIILINNKPVGSELLGQNFESDIYFHGRPSFSGYDGVKSGASNMSVTNKDFNGFVKEKHRELAEKFAVNELPKELYTYSASGLDPHVSKEAALLQVDNIIKGRNLNADKKNSIIGLIDKFTEKRDLGVLGEERINILKLNIALDTLK